MTNKSNKEKPTEKLIFSSDIFDMYSTDEDKYEAFINYCECRGIEKLKEKYKTWEDVEKNSKLEQKIYDFMYDEIQWIYDDLITELLEIYKNDEFILHGSLRLWNGSHDGYKYCGNFESVLSTVCNYDTFEIIQDLEEKCTALRLHHHDGTNYMYIRKLNGRHIKVAEDRGVSLNDMWLEDLQKISGPYYSKKLDMAADIKKYKN